MKLLAERGVSIKVDLRTREPLMEPKSGGSERSLRRATFSSGQMEESRMPMWVLAIDGKLPNHGDENIVKDCTSTC